jgi:hypothetical protein
MTKSKAGMEALIDHYNQNLDVPAHPGTIGPPQCVASVITDCAKRLGLISKPDPCQQRDFDIAPPTDPMDLTTVEICAADFPILLVESTFR